LADTVLQNQNNPELIFNLGNRYVSSVTDTSYTTTQVFRNVSLVFLVDILALTFGSAPLATLSFPFGNGAYRLTL
jgi:zona occludens toxin (predicted ATPase)